MRDVSMRALRRLQRLLRARLTDLIDWDNFSLEAVVSAVAHRVGGEIHVHAFHWDRYAYSGLTLGWVKDGQKQFLILFEEQASDEHRLIIILHELIHILLGHCTAILAPRVLRQVLVEIGFLPADVQPVMHTRVLLPVATSEVLPVRSDDDELEAELGATMVVTRARQAGTLPPVGRLFTPEQTSISRLLGCLAEE